MFPALNLPQASLRLTKSDNQYLVWDEWRKKQVVLTPEEWVRQHLLHHLVQDLDYPLTRMAVEMQIEVNGLKRRCDAVVFDLQGKAQVLIECKEPEVVLSAEVVQQIAQYNAKLNTQWLILSNGMEHLTLRIEPQTGNFGVAHCLVHFSEIV